ncbi:hypothetical protein CPB83DRAFT_885775 [Crepidotus variabilis]|uniref:Phosphatidate phosphatase APP1 catalytic domain-containing protein n=1 Tax=Crepidotus variabilis TaxID=179855 RepID=A0A9P6E9X1_9AGAR|nr:hypothetical protein CPB83DRAFT_885775 [Crepidotus variabilis]
MSNEMPSSSWRYLSSAGSRLSSFKGYISGREPGGMPRSPRGTPGAVGEERQGWRAWAGQKIRGRGRNGNDPAKEEFINLFPGWAARRYVLAPEHHLPEGPPPFSIEIFVSGFASTSRGVENASRSQKAFVRLAKGFASLPKLVESLDPLSIAASSTPNLPKLSRSTEELLAHTTLPPRPEEITPEMEIEAIEEQFRRAKDGTMVDDEVESTSSSSSRSSLYEASTTDSPIIAPPLRQANSGTESPDSVPTPVDYAKRWHENLEKRLQMLWYSVLPNRTVRLHLFVSHNHEDEGNGAGVSTPGSSKSAWSSNSWTSFGSSSSSSSTPDLLSIDSEYGPLASADVTTAPDGSFQFKFHVKWEALCQHPRALHIAYGDAIQEHDLLVVAQLLPSSENSLQAGLSVGTPGTPGLDTPRSISSGSYFNHHYRTYQGRSTPLEQQGPPLGSPANSPQASLLAPGTPATPVLTPPPLITVTRIPVTHSPIRVVSDIDDTVKYAGILGGARAAFHNVFVKDLKDAVIPGMGEWYAMMYSRGVRFHYVSNGPFSVLPMLNEFFELSQLPPGSIKLKSYAGRSIFSGLTSAPAARKRAGVVEVLDSFPDSRFFLIGDTGEQDLELYTEIAKERPNQILAVFLRDADTVHPGSSPTETPPPLSDPTGTQVLDLYNVRPGVQRNDSSSSWSQFWNRGSNSGDMKAQQTPTSDPTLPPYSAEATPRPNRHSLDTSGAPGPRSGLNEGGLASAHQKGYFGSGPLSAEPISENFDTQSLLTPTRKSARLPGDDTVVPRGERKSASHPLPRPNIRQQPDATINQPPKPVPAPSFNGAQSTLKPNNASVNPRHRTSSTSSTTSTNSSVADAKTDVDKRRLELQLRIHRSRQQIPAHIPLRVFRDTAECVEMSEVLHREEGALARRGLPKNAAS